MLRGDKILKKRVGILLISALAVGLESNGWALVCDIGVPPTLSIEEDNSSFTLSFTDFVSGTHSSTHGARYRIECNHMAAGAVSEAVSAKLGEIFESAKLEASVDSYENVGDSSYATLSAAYSGFEEVRTSTKSLANKQTGAPCCDTCLDGWLNVTWRAILTQDTAAGSQNRSLIVTLRDGN